MQQMWTKNGRPLLNDGNTLLLPSGTVVGQISGDRVFTGEDRAYVGTLVGDRLVFRSFDIDGPDRHYARVVTRTEVSSVEPARMWGDEPTLPE